MRMLNQHGNDFIKTLNHIKASKSPYEVFNDWLVMTAAALYSWKNDQAVENEYTETAEQYKKEELEKHGQLLEITVDALEKTEKDFLGEVFTELNLTNKRGGQFFTPYNVSLMMARMIIGSNELPAGRVCKVNDPTCGAGGMLVAGAMVMKERGFDFQNNAFFVGQDIDARCARMTYIQLSLLGVPAVVYHMNTLTMQEYWHRETIGYHMADMDFRLRAEEMLDIIKNPKPQKAETAEIPEEKAITIPPAGECVQGELF